MSPYASVVAFQNTTCLLADITAARVYIEIIRRRATEGCRLAGVDPYDPDNAFMLAVTVAQRAVCEMEQIAGDYLSRQVVDVRDPTLIAAEYANERGAESQHHE